MAGQASQVGADGVVFLLDVVGGVVAFDDLDARKRFVEHAYHVAHAFLPFEGRVAQFFDDPSDDERHYGQEQDGEQGQLPRYEEHVDHVTDNKQRIAEGDLQRIGDAVLDHHDVLCDARHEIALALIAEISGVHPHDFVEQIVAHALQRPDTHVFDRPGAHVAEEIAQQVHYDRTAGEQEEHFRHREIRPEQLRIEASMSENESPCMGKS